MNTRENRRKWTAALRSGEFEQNRGHLRNGGGFCCLGVACEVFRRETGEGRWVARTGYGGFESFVSVEGGASDALVLPESVRSWLGLRTNAGDDVFGDSLGSRNDHGASFEIIADVIDAEPVGLVEDGA